MINKKWVGMTFIGAGLGITLSFLITLAISAGLGTGDFYPCPPELTEEYGSELAGVEVQTIVSAVYGAGCVLCARIWKIEAWSLVRQSAVYFTLLCTIGMFCGYIAYWMPHDLAGAFRFFLIFVVIFAVVWIAEYGAARRKVRKLNEDLDRTRSANR